MGHDVSAAWVDELDAPTTVGQDTGATTDLVSSIHSQTLGQIGPYDLLAEISRGAMGIVYRARHRSLDRLVAIKMILHCDTSVSQDSVARFEREAQLTASLNHPGIVPLYDFGKWEGRPYFAMALVEGPSLAGLIRDQPLTPQRAATLAAEIADAMQHAHEHGIVHRDLKPANVLVDRCGAARVTDFGVSKSLRTAANQTAAGDLTAAGQMIGTPYYMSPEQARGQSDRVGPSSDVYAIGAVLFAMLTGRPPFQAASPIDVIASVLMQPPPRPSDLLASNVPIDLETITLKCLAKEPHERYATACDLEADLRRFLSGEPILARPPGFVQRWIAAYRRHVLLASLSGTAAVLLVTLLLIGSVAFVHMRWRMLTVQEQLDRERQSAADFLRSRQTFENQEENPALTPEMMLREFEIARLTQSAEALTKSGAAAATALSLQAGRLAVQQDQPFPARLRQLISRQLKLGEAPWIGDKESLSQLEALGPPILSEVELQIYGIEHWKESNAADDTH